MRYLLCVVLIIVSTSMWAQDPASAATKVTKPAISCEGKVLILRSGAWTCETVTGGPGTTYSFSAPMSENSGTVTIDLSGYSQTNHTHAAYAAKQDAIPSQTVTLQKFLTSWDATSKTFGTAQPSCGGLSDSGNGCLRNVGTTSNTLAAGDDSRITGALPANGITSTGGTLTLPGADSGVLIPDGGTPAANRITAASGVPQWYTSPLFRGQGGTVTTGSINGSASAVVTLTWAAAFPDANYAFHCEVLEATTTGSTLRKHHVTARTTTTISALIINDDSSAHTGTLSCIGGY